VLIDALNTLKAELLGTGDFEPNKAINDNGTVNLDVQGLALDQSGQFWVASEGAGTLVNGVSNPADQPFESPNLVARVAKDGTIEEVILLPLELTKNQLRFGFEGVAVARNFIYVAFQREWIAAGDPANRVRIRTTATNKNGGSFTILSMFRRRPMAASLVYRRLHCWTTRISSCTTIRPERMRRSRRSISSP
jgi:hypothetical protein